MQYRDYQQKLDDDIFAEWNAGAQCVAAQSPTGSGKTVVISNVIKKLNTPTVVIAHRQELVTQISMALAHNGLHHGLIGSQDVVRLCNRLHLKEFNKTFYDANSTVRVASINTLTSKKTMPQVKRWAHNVGLWVMDEGHHLLRDNMWGRGIELFPQAKGLGVSAWFGRSDGKGLGSHADGFYDSIVYGPQPGELIQQGHLCQFRIYGVPSDINTEGLAISKVTGDYTKNKLRERVHKSKIVGDVVAEYLKHAPGKLGVTFVTDTKTAQLVAQKFNANGVKAVAIDANTPTDQRSKYLEQFARREIMQIVNVDIFGEGFDCPAIECISFARPTASYSLFIQQFGRALRILKGKEFAIIIDHVNNVIKFGGAPMVIRPSTLDRREGTRRSKKDPDDIPMKGCKKCLGVYESFYVKCPLPLPSGEICGYEYIPQERGGPEEVEGDLVLLDEFIVDALQREIEKADEPPNLTGNNLWDAGTQRKHIESVKARKVLKETMATWAGIKRDEGYTKRERSKMFYHMFRFDVLTAQALNRKDSEELNTLIKGTIS